MKSLYRHLTAPVLFVAACALPAFAQTNPPPLDPLALTWPRAFTASGYDYAVYQPQISAWPGNQLEGRFAVATRPTGTSNETYGVVFFTARTEIDKAARLVTLEDFTITRTKFPTAGSLQNLFQAALQSELPQTARTVPLDHLEAVFAASADIEKVKMQQVQNTPPRVLYTTQPSLLVLVDGAPILHPLEGNYLRVVNTRSVLLENTNWMNQGYYLYAASNWFTAPSIEGPWTVNLNPPPDIGTALSAALATKAVDPAYPREPLAAPPTIYVSTVPTELIQTTGTANLLTVAGTDLLYVGNCLTPLFYYLDDANYYMLISGRWFKSLSLYGPWGYVAKGQLPADFSKIPPESPMSHALVSVPGTPQAQEAVIASTIPQTTGVHRDQAKAEIEYVGAPAFAPIPTTKLAYATNTVTPVIQVNPASYYACQGGIWFVAPAATGPWAVATSVPASIYTIPVSSPIHYVTYVYVYGYTPQVVYVGYTPGYMGVMISAGGTVVYGTGYVYPPVVVGTTYIAPPPTYGYGATMAMSAAVGFAFGYCAGHNSSCYYEPYWGGYHYAYPCSTYYHGYNVNSASYYSHWGTATTCGSAGYNPWTGTSYANRSGSAYNPYTGTHASGYSSASFNPYSGNASASRSGSAYNPYSGASVSGNASANANIYSGNYNASRSASGYNPSTGRSGSTSASISGNAYNGDYNASRSSSMNNQYTGTSAQNTKSVSGNAYNGTASVNNTGSAENSKTGNSASWNNGSMTTDKNGNTYSYNKGSTSENQSTWQSAHPSSSSYSSAQSSWASKQGSAQATGQQRADSWSSHSSGGGGWGGSGGWGSSGHSYGGGGGGGFHRR
jgi:hypothetical protein